MQNTTIDPWEWQRQFSYSQARLVTGAHRVLHIAGQTSVGADGRATHVGDMRGQLAQAFDNLQTVLAASELGLPDIVRLNYFTTDVDALFGCWDVVTDRLRDGPLPASSLLGVNRLAYPELLVELEATAVASA